MRDERRPSFCSAWTVRAKTQSAIEKLLRVLIDPAKRDAWIERLRSVEELNVNHAETELHVLELFAIQQRSVLVRRKNCET